MAILVQKFGGTSVGDIARIRAVARRVLRDQQRGISPVVVVSAMTGETNRLVSLMREISPTPDSKEYDLVLASGEQVTAGLLALAINTEAGRPGAAHAFLAHQLGIRTDRVYSKARIQQINTVRLLEETSRGVIPVIAGFQGVDEDNNITTLGRGGSDTSAVAIAAALGASVCEIYTDVNGVYTTDPRLCSSARKIPQITYDDMMEMAGRGAKVLQIRSVELAAVHGLRIHVRSSFNDEEGTMVMSRTEMGESLERIVVAGIAVDASQVQFSLGNLPSEPGVLASIFGTLAEKTIDVDVIVQNVQPDGRSALSFTVAESDGARTRGVLRLMPKLEVVENDRLAKISVIGVGMQNHPGVAATMFKTLAALRIDIALVSTSEIKISCLISKDRIQEAVTALHSEYGLA